MPEFIDLTPAEQRIAAVMVCEVADRLPWDRVREVFRALARGDALSLHSVGGGYRQQLLLPLGGVTLLRNERAIALGVYLGMTMAAGEEVAARLVRVLAAGDNVFAAAVFGALQQPGREPDAHEAVH